MIDLIEELQNRRRELTNLRREELLAERLVGSLGRAFRVGWVRSNHLTDFAKFRLRGHAHRELVDRLACGFANDRCANERSTDGEQLGEPNRLSRGDRAVHIVVVNMMDLEVVFAFFGFDLADAGYLRIGEDRVWNLVVVYLATQLEECVANNG